MNSTHLTITLFGEFSLTPTNKPAVSFSGDRPISLLAYLLLHRHTAVSRQHLAFTLWPDSSDSQARANLRNLFYTLRQTLPNADAYLAADAMTLQWRTDASFTQKSHELAVRCQDQWGVVISQAYLGVIMRGQGHLAEAAEQLTTVLSQAKAIGDPRLIAYTLLASGRTNFYAGNLAAADQQLTSCLEIARETNDLFNITNSSLYLGLVKQAGGDLTAARKLIQQSVALCTQTNDLFGLQDASISLGFLEIATGDFPAARSQFLAILQMENKNQETLFLLPAVVGMAALQAYEGNNITALRWVFTVLEHPALHVEARQRAETLCAELQERLTPDQITRAQQEAAEQSLDAIVASIVGS